MNLEVFWRSGGGRFAEDCSFGPWVTLSDAVSPIAVATGDNEFFMRGNTS
jgi:hypothetical protein